MIKVRVVLTPGDSEDPKLHLVVVTERTLVKRASCIFIHVFYVLEVFSNSMLERTKTIKTSNQGSSQDGRLCCCPQAKC